MADRRMTPTERLVLDALCRSVRDHGAPPTLEHLQQAAKLPSLAAVHFFLDNLQRKGLIRQDPAQPRVIEVVCSALATASQAEAAASAQAEEPEPPSPLPRAPGSLIVATGVERPSGPADVEAADEPMESRPAVTTSVIPNSAPVTTAPGQVGTTDDLPEGRVFGRGERPGGSDSTMVTVPLVGRVAAGRPIDSVPGEVLASYQLPRALVGQQNPLFMVRVQGASMVEMGIHDEDLVVAHRRRDVENGQIVVACDEYGDATVKRFWRSDDGRRVELRSANPDIAPLDLATGQAEVLGRVVAIIRAL
jgi:SOS regulatory protein LexA